MDQDPQTPGDLEASVAPDPQTRVVAVGDESAGAEGDAAPVPADDLAALRARIEALEDRHREPVPQPPVVPSDHVNRGVVDLEPLPVHGIDKDSPRWLAVHAPGNGTPVPFSAVPDGAA